MRVGRIPGSFCAPFAHRDLAFASMFGGRVSSRTTCVCLHLHSAASSQVDYASSARYNVQAFDSVVVPDRYARDSALCSGLGRILGDARTLRPSSLDLEPAGRASALSFLIFRMVSAAVDPRGGAKNDAFTRKPSARRASPIVEDSSTPAALADDALADVEQAAVGAKRMPVRWILPVPSMNTVRAVDPLFGDVRRATQRAPAT